MQEGDKKTVVYKCYARECAECGEPATYLVTYLLEGTRRNPKSKAYRTDDCSWCKDEETYACNAHVDTLSMHPPQGYVWCSRFPRASFPHMLLFWHEVSTVIEPAQADIGDAVEALAKDIEGIKHD